MPGSCPLPTAVWLWLGPCLSLIPSFLACKMSTAASRALWRKAFSRAFVRIRCGQGNERAGSLWALCSLWPQVSRMRPLCRKPYLGCSTGQRQLAQPTWMPVVPVYWFRNMLATQETMPAGMWPAPLSPHRTGGCGLGCRRVWVGRFVGCVTHVFDGVRWGSPVWPACLTGTGTCGSGQVSLSAATSGIVKIFTLPSHTFRYMCATFYEFIEM